jgi:hypothetical protein
MKTATGVPRTRAVTLADTARPAEVSRRADRDGSVELVALPIFGGFVEVEINVPRTVCAKTIEISAKCSDCFAATLYAPDGTVLKEYDGYVPDFFPGDHYGDYVMLNIDIETGQILNWRQPRTEQLAAFINGDSE